MSNARIRRKKAKKLIKRYRYDACAFMRAVLGTPIQPWQEYLIDRMRLKGFKNE